MLLGNYQGCFLKVYDEAFSLRVKIPFLSQFDATRHLNTEFYQSWGPKLCLAHLHELKILWDLHLLLNQLSVSLRRQRLFDYSSVGWMSGFFLATRKRVDLMT